MCVTTNVSTQCYRGVDNRVAELPDIDLVIFETLYFHHYEAIHNFYGGGGGGGEGISIR